MKKSGSKEGSAFNYGMDDKDLEINQHPNAHRPKRHAAHESAGHDSNPSVARPHVGHEDVARQHNATTSGNRGQSIYSGSKTGGNQ